MLGDTDIALINAIVDSVQFDEHLDDGVVDRITRLLVTQPMFDMTPDAEYDALVSALRFNVELREPMTQRHDARELRDFLTRVRDRMDDMRPWPELPYRRLSAAEWPAFASSRPVARLAVNGFEAQNRFRMMFDSVEHDGAYLNVLILRLRSGSEVALVSPVPGMENVTVRVRGEMRADEIAAELAEAADLRQEEITAL